MRIAIAIPPHARAVAGDHVTVLINDAPLRLEVVGLSWGNGRRSVLVEVPVSGPVTVGDVVKHERARG